MEATTSSGVVRYNWLTAVCLIHILQQPQLTLALNSTSNESQQQQRYPYILPKCCSLASNPYQGRHSKEFKNVTSQPVAGVDACRKEGSEIVLLPRKFFPGMPHELEYVEVELRNLVNGLECNEGVDEPILIDLEQVEFNLETVSFGSTNGFREYAFSGSNLLADQQIYSSKHYCVSSSTKSKTKLDIKTCTVTRNPETVFIPRCCRGHQSTLTASPNKSSLDEYCSTPKLSELGAELWNPMASKILQWNSHSLLCQKRGDEFVQPNCELLYFRESSMENGTKAVTLLSNGSLILTSKNRTRVVDNFCMDGEFVDERNETDSLLGLSLDTCQVGSPQEEVVILCIPFETNEALEEKRSIPNTNADDFIKLPYCSCGTFDKEMKIPRKVVRHYAPGIDTNENSTVPVRVMIMDKENEFRCPYDLQEENTLEFSDIEIFASDGSLIFGEYLLDYSQYCIRSIYDNAVTVRTCRERCSENNPCVNRCCSGNNHVNWEEFNKLPEEQRFDLKCEPQSPNGTIRWNHLPFFDNSNSDIHLTIRKRRPASTNCAFFTANKADDGPAMIAIPYKMQNGELLEKTGRIEWEKVELRDYCVEPYMRPSGETGELFLTGKANEILVWRCWNSTNEDKDVGYIETKAELFAGLYFTFSLFYLAIAVAYSMRSDKGPVFRWSIVSCSLSMMLTYWFFAYTRISFYFHYQSEDTYWTSCAIIGMVANFIYLNSFSWITVLCFDIWFALTFVTSPGKQSIKLFFSYFAVTLVLPAGVVGTGIVLDVFYAYDTFSEVISPAYGIKRCLFEPVEAALPFLYGPLAVLTCINFILFFLTVIKLWIARHSSEITKTASVHDSSRTHAHTFLLYLKLFLMMGLLWALETISWIFVPLNQPLAWWGVLMEIVTLLQPAFVFMFLVWNKETKKHLGAKSPRINRFIEFVDGIWITRCGILKGNNSNGNGTAISSSSGTKETPLYKS